MITVLYIDPGTGSMLFTIFIGIFSGLYFLWRKLVIKLKFLFKGGGKAASEASYTQVIFSDSKRYWNVFKPVCDEFERRKLPLEYMTASADDPALSEHYEYVHPVFIGEGNKAFARLNLLHADLLLSTTPGLDVYQWKRSRFVKHYAHIFHAVDEGLGYRMFGMDYYDSILLTGEFQGANIRKLEELRGLPAKELCVTGSTYMDALKEKYENAAASHPGHEGIHVLLAPSWGPSAILSRYGERLIRALIDTGFHVTVRPHPQSLVSEREILDPLMAAFPESDAISWNFDNDNFQVLMDSDIMITDFSGIIFDFALVFGRPVIYADTSFDPSPYDAAWIDEPLWRFQALEKLGKPLREEDFGSLKAFIESLVHNADLETGRSEIRDTAWQYRGQSAVRTVDFMIKKAKEC